MISKNVVFRPPWNDALIVQLELLLGNFAKESARVRVGEYVGDGLDSRNIVVGARPLLVLVMKAEAGSGDAVFAIRGNPSVSYIPSSGFVSDAITSFDPTGFTVGLNANINTALTAYRYLVVL